MKIHGFDWDRGNWPKCGKHGVTQEEIEYILTHDPMVLSDRSPQDQETRYNAVGRNKNGRYVFIVFALRQFDREKFFRPISARYMHRQEIQRYEEE